MIDRETVEFIAGMQRGGQRAFLELLESVLEQQQQIDALKETIGLLSQIIETLVSDE